MIEDQEDWGIDAEVNTYLDAEPAATWLRESGDERDDVAAVLGAALIDARESNPETRLY